MRKFDLFVIGAGSGGVRAARLAAKLGAKVCIAESSRIGGTCAIRGCVPKKLSVYASRFADELQKAPAYGWDVRLPEFNWAQFKANRDTEVARLEGVYQAVLEQAGVSVVNEHASFADPHTLRLGRSGELIQAERVLIATGGIPSPARGIPGGQYFATSDAFFDWKEQPHSVVIQGGGYIATEYASILARLGTKVTLVHREETLLKGFDSELRALIMDGLIASRVEILAGHTVREIERTSKGFSAKISNGHHLHVDIILGATGRVANTGSLHLANAGVKHDDDGVVYVDEFSKTNVEHIHAIGDVTNRLNLTPAAIKEAQAYVRTVFQGIATAVDHSLAPTSAFTTPEIAYVGLTEETAILKHGNLDVFTSNFRPMKNTLCHGNERVFLKLLVNRDDDRVVGCHMVGADASEMIQLLAISMMSGVKKRHFDETMSLHPTVGEEWVTMREPTRRYGTMSMEDGGGLSLR